MVNVIVLSYVLILRSYFRTFERRLAFLPADSMIAMAFVAGCQQLLLNNPVLVAPLVWLRFLVMMNCRRW